MHNQSSSILLRRRAVEERAMVELALFQLNIHFKGRNVVGELSKGQ